VSSSTINSWLWRQGSAFVPVTAGGIRPDVLGEAVGHAVQPAAERFAPADRSRPAEKHEERRLEGILGLVGASQHAPAHAEDHRPVAPQEGRKRCLVARFLEALQQEAVARPVLGRAGPAAEPGKDRR